MLLTFGEGIRTIEYINTKKNIFFIGNDSSSTIIQHLAVDLNIAVRGDNHRWQHFLFKVIPLTYNLASVTAWGNDHTYSRNSPNVLNSAQFFRKKGASFCTSLFWWQKTGDVS